MGSGSQLRYDDEAPVLSIDRGGTDQEQRMADFVTKSIDNLSHGRTVQDAMENLNLRDQKDLIPGLEIRLLPHQLIGVSWMVDQELHSPHKGGILAYVHFIRKTVQMIATMAMNLPEEHSAARSTLIVVPAALLLQWKEEIETKTNSIFTVHVHHGRDKLKNVEAVRSKDVVITTYQTLNQDFIAPPDVDSGDEQQWLAKHGGTLARVKWYRVILDEAQFIRNRSTSCSQSVAMLRSTYRWMLTGTPVTNTLADIYGLIRFGRFRPWNDWNDFNVYIAKMQRDDPPLAAFRAQEILKPLLLRRTKNSEIEGKPILQLPPKDIELVTLEFSKDEREVYDSFEKKSKIQVNRFIKARTLLKNHAFVLVLILRLRQLCCHPQLILSQTEDYSDPTLLVSDDKEKEIGRAIKTMGWPWVTDIKKRFLTRALANDMMMFSDEADEPEATCPVCKDLYMHNTGRILACGHELCFDCIMDLKNAPIAHDGQFGHGNEKENLKLEKEYELAVAKGFRPCPTCKKMNDFSPNKVFISSAFEPDEEALEKAANAKRRKRRMPAKTEDNDDESDIESKPVIRSPKRFRGDTPEGESSDDDLPDFSQMFASDTSNTKKTKSKAAAKKVGSSSSKQLKPINDDDVIDLTMDDISTKDLTESSDVEISAITSSPAASSSPSSPTKPRRGKKGGKQVNESRKKGNGKHNEASNGMSDALIATWKKGDDDLEPSTKMMALIRLLQEWDVSGDKTICFSQWTSMIDLVEILLSRYGIQNLRYDGGMDRTARDRALSAFKQQDGPKVILISTKCGGVGLNLVAANRIINLDLSWNYASESQAYDRVHRLGQEKDVFVKRLVVKDTIEERMLKLQDVKVGLADAALGEGTGIKLHKMSVREIKALFGMTSSK
ncbi:hypothetical protein SERLA73DRAFT_103014 [Serpula lacrymans var. lacrymans S7.3]|uniref:Uncharacterized protein n=1 Tax=Serpula lacrymans var. lacrymans (strain S7.3) TaxID=936435 RepID=F8PMW7_SERL3|nr:hypothetical protein SERLA73DRAFT_103014 [Serpula lacrymans var. lacrymans S7.3]